jgi:hypothetical protein
MKRVAAFLKSSFLRWWLAFAAVFTISPTCPCCGRPGCPGGFAAGAVLGGILAALAKVFSRFGRKSGAVLPGLKTKQIDKSC